MGKTDSIKERRVDVYLDTLERKERWTEAAEEEDESLSKFVQRAVEYALADDGFEYQTLGEQSKQLQELKQEVEELREDVKQKDMVIEKLEDELRKHQLEKFTGDDEDNKGKRRFDQEVVDLLRDNDTVSGEELRHHLDIDPSNTELMEALQQHLQELEDIGVVTSTSQGWTWTG